jgi:gliding motility-associated-like protein
MKHTYKLGSVAIKALCFLVLIVATPKVAMACHGVALLNVNFTNTGSSIVVNADSDPATCGCGPYYMQAEVALSNPCFTGNAPPCGSPMWGTYPWYTSLLDVPNYNAAAGWPDNCVVEPYLALTVPFADLCAGTTYVIRVREFVCGGPSAGPWSVVYTFTTPGTATPVIVTTTASEYTGCPGDTVQLFANATGGCPGTLFNYSWTPVAGLSNPNIANPMLVLPGTATTYTLAVTSQCGQVFTATDDTVNITVGPPPIPGSITANPPSVCSGGSTTLTLSGQDPNSLLQWQISPNGINWFNISGANGTTYNTGPITTSLYYQVIITGSGWYPGSGCGTSVSSPIQITVNPSPIANAGPNTTICAGACITLNGSGGVGYTWQPNGQTTQSITVCPTVATTYTLDVVDANGCTGSDAITVNVSTASVTASPDVSICTGSNTILVASGPNGNSYAWTPNNGTLNNPNISNPTATPATTTTYTVTATNQFGCIATDMITVTVTPAPPLTVSNDTTMCTGGSVTLTASGASSFNWQPGNQNTSSISVMPTQTTTFVVSGNTNNCISYDTIVVTINPPPAVFAGPDLAICRGTQAALNVATTGNSYNWAPSSSIIGSSTVQNVIIQPTVNTSYTVTVVGAGGCISTDTINVQVNNPPTVTATASDNSICVGQTTTLSGGGAVAYSWIPTYGVSNPNFASTGANPPNTTTYQVVGVDQNGCIDTASITITVNPLPDIYMASTPSECGGSTGTMTHTTTGAGTGPFTYTVGSTPYTTTPINNLAAGSYNVTVTDANGCSSTSVVTVGQQNTAFVNGSATPPFGTYPLTVSFGASGSSGLTDYSWSFGDGVGTANTQSSSYLYTQPGVYQVIVMAYSNSPGCAVYDTLYVEVVEQAVVAFPNVFTPNGDGTNDGFAASISGVKDMDVEIYDRWGNQVFNTTMNGINPSPQTLQLWDGKSNGGNMVADGVYYYVIRSTGYDQKEYPMTGFVHLMQEAASR